MFPFEIYRISDLIVFENWGSFSPLSFTETSYNRSIDDLHLCGISPPRMLVPGTEPH